MLRSDGGKCRERRKMSLPKVVSREEWLAAREELLAKEKEATRARDALNAERRMLPMVRIEKDYAFEAPDGEATLLDMFDPEWEDGCPSCTYALDDFGDISHLHDLDTSLTRSYRGRRWRRSKRTKRSGDGRFRGIRRSAGISTTTTTPPPTRKSRPSTSITATPTSFGRPDTRLTSGARYRIQRIPARRRAGAAHVLDLRAGC